MHNHTCQGRREVALTEDVAGERRLVGKFKKHSLLPRLCVTTLAISILKILRTYDVI